MSGAQKIWKACHSALPCAKHTLGSLAKPSPSFFIAYENTQLSKEPIAYVSFRERQRKALALLFYLEVHVLKVKLLRKNAAIQDAVEDF